jgi:hypothetical protein
MIALIVLSSGQLWAGGGRATGRAIGGPMSALCPALSLPAAGPPVLLSLLVIFSSRRVALLLFLLSPTHCSG